MSPRICCRTSSPQKSGSSPRDSSMRLDNGFRATSHRLQVDDGRRVGQKRRVVYGGCRKGPNALLTTAFIAHSRNETGGLRMRKHWLVMEGDGPATPYRTRLAGAGRHLPPTH